VRVPRVAIAIVAVCAFALTDCVRVPNADDLAQGPRVDEIVRRVKCDLYEALADRLNAPYGYEWLQAWTAQANLNLIVNDQSILSPGAVITEPLRAVTVPQKVTNFGQSFNFGLGISANNTATRNETITFTVSLDELMVGNGRQNCDFPNYMDLRSELGLKDWIESSLSPVEDGYLKIGYHKTPKTGSSAGTATAAKGSSNVIAAYANLQKSNALRGQRATQPVNLPDCEWPRGFPSASPDRAEILLDLRVVICDLITFYNPVVVDTNPSKPLAPHPAAPPAKPQAGEQAKPEAGQQPAPGMQPTAPPPIHDLTNATGSTVKFVVKTIQDIQVTIRDLETLGPSGAMARKALESTARDLAAFVDPPLDTISHQVQFIIVWNASASPSWTLLHFKGPSPSSGSLFSATATKTHTLNIVLGSPSSPDSAGALQALQIGSAVGNALTTGVIP
jgi:hypothetical protein